MRRDNINPFDECPIYETERFIFRLVNETDSDDLFICYSDPITLKHMNNDNCNGEWHPKSADEIKYAWQKDYERRTFVRWSIIDKSVNRAIGTIEIAPLPWGKWFFGKETPVGILRIDILSSFERQDIFSEIIYMIAAELANDFEVKKIIMKAPPDEPDKVKALIENDFTPDIKKEFKYDHYYVRINNSV